MELVTLEAALFVESHIGSIAVQRYFVTAHCFTELLQSLNDTTMVHKKPVVTPLVPPFLCWLTSSQAVFLDSPGPLQCLQRALSLHKSQRTIQNVCATVYNYI